MDIRDAVDQHLLETTKKLLAAEARITELEKQLQDMKNLVNALVEGNNRLAQEAGSRMLLALNPPREDT